MGNWRIMAEDHWKKFLPAYYAELKARGILEQTLDKAEQDMRETFVTLVTEQGMYPHEAREIALPQYILLTPEPDWETEMPED